MPRRQLPKQRVEILADVLEALQVATEGLEDINLSKVSVAGGLRAKIKDARTLTQQATQATLEALKSETPDQVTPVPDRAVG